MSKIALEGNASGIGTFTISAPNGNTDRTLVLPDEAGTVLTSAGVPASAMPAGSVLQVVQTTTSTYATNSSATYASTGLSTSITPSSSSSKILVIAYCPLRFGSSNAQTAGLRINRGGTVVMTDKYVNNVSSVVDISYPITMTYLDSPSATSSTTYTIEFASLSSASPYGYPAVNWSNNGSTLATLTLMEVAA